MLLDALTLQLGYNATLVALGTAMLGAAAGLTGTFLFLRKRALVSDAISHATLPGIGLAFIVMVALGGDGRNLIGLMAGSALTAWLGLVTVQWLATRTRLGEDAAIGAVLSVFFGAGIVLLTVIQTLSAGRQAGLEGFLLGSTAGMLRSEALVIAAGAALALALVLVLRRQMTIVAFDPGYGAAIGLNVRAVDLATMGLVMAVTVVGLKVVGLVLIVALVIIPPVAARFWSERSEVVALTAALIGGASGYIGAAFSASAPDLPTGPMVVLSAFAIFALSMALAPERGVLAALLRHRRYQTRVHLRQGLLALARGDTVYERLTRRLLAREGLAGADGVATDEGRARAALALRDEARWELLRRLPAYEAVASLYDGVGEIEAVLTPDQIADIDARLGEMQGAGA